MKVQKFARKVFFVDGVEVTKENLEEVAEWCGGSVKTTTAKPEENLEAQPYVKVPILKYVNERQTKAFVGDVVTKSGNQFKVYTASAFRKSFEELVSS